MSDGKRHRTIPIFMPERACPFRCIYCNQYVITGQGLSLSDDEIIKTIEERLATIGENCETELGFFGGTFTGLPIGEQERMLKIVEPYLSGGKIKSIRLSTRPDYIDKNVIALLKKYGVGTVELGVQSLDDEVLRKTRRGYDSRCVYDAVEMLQKNAIDVGMQMMIGLPGDSKEKSINTARKIIECGATNTRIYPTLVVKNTVLATMYERGEYEPLTLDEAIAITKQIMPMFEEAGVTVLRVGLHPTEGFIKGSDYLAGPFHVSFRELVETAIWRDILEREIQSVQGDNADTVTVTVSPDMVNWAVGYHSANRVFLEERYKRVKFVTDEKTAKRDVKLSIETTKHNEKYRNRG